MSLISSLKKILHLNRYNRIILAVNIAVWKRELFNKLFDDANIVYVPLKNDIYNYKRYIKKSKKVEILIWGYKECRNISAFSKEFSISVTRVEDGFLRSFGLGLDKVIPYSLCFDKTGLYYNSLVPSDFETIANAHSEIITEDIIDYAKNIRKELIACSATKYNLRDLKRLKYPKKCKERILVVGQVETDKSILYSGAKIKTNLDLIKYVKEKNPNAEIIFKKHPDEIKKQIGVKEIDVIADFVINDNVLIDDLLTDIDRVYTISSLLGFEALIRNKAVYTVGMPFYAGWGLTNDLLKCERRTAKLSLNELLAVTYLLYPTYLDDNFKRIPAIEYISNYLNKAKQFGNFNPIDFVKLTGKDNKPKVEVKSKTKTKPNPNPNPKTKTKQAIDKKNESKNESKTNNKNINASVNLNKTVDSDIYAILNFKDSYAIMTAVKEHKKFFLYIEWITAHTDVLVAELDSTYQVLPLNMVYELTASNRKLLSNFSNNDPIAYRNYIRKRLFSLKECLYGVILTFDWAPITRIVAEVCHELNIYTILIPHESIFLDRDMFYKHPVTFASCPVCDEALVWGEAQKDIFVSRGYPEERISIVGSPKLDKCINYQPVLSRELFARFYSLNPGKKIILFACQNLDIQIDTKVANISQNQAIRAIIDYCVANNVQLIVRLPPSSKDVLFTATKEKISAVTCCTVDRTPYLSSPGDCIYHSAAVVSLNSTMLFEAVLMKRPAISVRYVDGINSLWNETLIPVVHNSSELFSNLSRVISEGFVLSEDGSAQLGRLAHLLGTGAFDGKSVDRIKLRLQQISAGNDLRELYDVKSSFFKKKQIDVVRISSTSKVLDTTQKYLKNLLCCNTLLNRNHSEINELSAVELFIQWGGAASVSKQYQQRMARYFCRDTIYIEDGFIRSCNIGLSGEPGLSIICDDLSPYYDATVSTRIETILNSDTVFSDNEILYARKMINTIVENKISKYNSAPLRKYNLGRYGYPKVLLIDQRFNDYSVLKGLGSIDSFKNMLTDAINQFPEYDILIKQHPDAILGSKGSYFNNEMLSFANKVNNIFVIDFDINPYELISLADVVFVCTSGMGFEALMAGKKVTCYGMPWYAGYGITEDKQNISRRVKRRTLEELFYVAYIKLSRYYNPDIGSNCSIDGVIDYIVRHR